MIKAEHVERSVLSDSDGDWEIGTAVIEIKINY